MAGGWPPAASSTANSPSRGRTVAQAALASACGDASRRSASLTPARIATGSDSRRASARTVLRTTPVSTAAAVPLPQMSPRATSQQASSRTTTS
jgi:hypothetical protein